MRLRWPIVALTVLLLAGSCGEDLTAPDPDEQAVEDVVRASIEAENAKDVDGFLEHWTDAGLKEYDVGSREDLEAGKSENFGSDRLRIVRFAETAISDGRRATATVDALVGEHQVVKPLNRVKFELINRDDEWLLNGFEFLGGAPPKANAEVVDLRAQEYAFVLERDEVPPDVAFRFANAGKEPHEITLFKGPDDLDIDRASRDLADVDGGSLDNVPKGYRVDHVSFAEPGKTVDVTFADELPAGTYVLACYIPQGGFPEEGEPDPNAKPHFQLGMRSLLKVT